jgi:trimeric autotransporter adhesin
MAKLRFKYDLYLLCAFIWLAFSSAAFASEHRGKVVFSGFPVPGASVTVIQGAKRITAITDLNGMYAFADLSDGTWKIDVEMQCFTTIHADVSITPNTPVAKWELTLLPPDQIIARTRIAQSPAHLPSASATVACPSPASTPARADS